MNHFADWENKRFSFFRHADCEYFPCHDLGGDDDSGFNCLFCFCPLYDREDCGGVFTYLERGHKDCSRCLLPHKKENYGLITRQLRHISGASPDL